MKEIDENELKDVSGGMTLQECKKQVVYVKAEINKLADDSQNNMNRLWNNESNGSHSSVNGEISDLDVSVYKRNARLDELGRELSRLTELCNSLE